MYNVRRYLLLINNKIMNLNKFIDTAKYTSITSLFFNGDEQIIVSIKGIVPEVVKVFAKFPVTFIIAMNVKNGKPVYSLFKEIDGGYIHIGDANKIATTDDYAICMWSTYKNQDGSTEDNFSLLRLDENGYYYECKLEFKD